MHAKCIITRDEEYVASTIDISAINHNKQKRKLTYESCVLFLEKYLYDIGRIQNYSRVIQYSSLLKMVQLSVGCLKWQPINAFIAKLLKAKIFLWETTCENLIVKMIFHSKTWNINYQNRYARNVYCPFIQYILYVLWVNVRQNIIIVCNISNYSYWIWHMPLRIW